jgi:5-formyltetrahydrofolate cyclo-ligase
VTREAAPSNKPELRRQFRARRQAHLPAAEAGLQRSAIALAAALKGEPLIGLYWPLAGEADLRDLTSQACLAMPRVAAGRLTYRRWRPGDAMAPDDTGIPAPALGPDLEASALGLLLVPALACDQRGFRLGYGGGWFDRLRSDPLWGAVPALAVLPAACLVDELPADPWDVPFSGWLDERGVHWLQGV